MSRVFANSVFLSTLLWDVLVCQVIRRQNWWDEIESGLILGALPTTGSVKRLSKLGVVAVVNMCEELSGPTQAYSRFGIDQLRVPTFDFCEPSAEDIRRAIDYIDLHRGNSGSVYIHCKSGRGRSATVVLCWLMKHFNLTPELAQERLQSKRGQVVKNLYQRNCVQQLSTTESLPQDSITPTLRKSGSFK